MISVLLSAGVVCANDVNGTDSYADGFADDALAISFADENDVGSSEILTSGLPSDANDTSEVSQSNKGVLEYGNSNILSTGMVDSLKMNDAIGEGAVFDGDASQSISKDLPNDDNVKLTESFDADENAILGQSNINTKLSAVYTGGVLIATLKDANGNPVSGAKVGFANNGVTYILTDKNGQARYSTKGLKDGTYTVKMKFYGKDSYSESNQVVLKIAVSKIATALTSSIANANYANGGYLVATLKDANGKPVSGVRVGFANNGVTYILTDKDGNAKYSTKDLAKGTYTVKMAFYGTESYAPSNQAVAKFTMSKIATNLNSSDLYVLRQHDDYLVATLTDANGKPVSGVKVGFANNGVTYIFTDKNGNAKYSTKNLAEGTYTVKIKFYGNDAYSESNQGVVKIVVGKIPTTLTSSDLMVLYGADSYLVATLKDANGKPVSGVRVGFGYNGVKYIVTNAKGQAKYSTKGMDLGAHIVKMAFYGTGSNAASNQAIAKVIVSNPTTKLTWKSGNSFVEGINTFKILLTDTSNVALPGKVVKLSVDSETFSATTDSNGYATFNVKVSSGKYTVSYSFPKDKLHEASKGSAKITVTKNLNLDDAYGYYVFGSDMKNVNLKSLADGGTTDLFLNYYAFEKHGKSAVESWIKSANKLGMRVHIWMQAFYEGSWVNPVAGGSYNYDYFDEKIEEAKYYAKINGVSGIHMDYLRYPGNAYNTGGGTSAISKFTKLITEELHKINPNLIVSAALMPETTSNSYYYGQDYSALSSYLDVVMPMIYKGNYGKSTSWIKSTAKWYADNSRGAKVWSVIQAYISDDDAKKLPIAELNTDIRSAISGGSDGVILFRYGLSNLANFNDM